MSDSERVFEAGWSVAVRPKGKARPRSGKGGHFYTPTATKQYEATLRAAAVLAWVPREPLAGPVVVSVLAQFKPPDTKEGRARLYHTQKPDGDNVAKAVKDALNGVIYGDDAQVIDLRVRKEWCLDGDMLTVKIWSVA